MIIREVREEERTQFNAVATHPLQAWEWGEFRQTQGSKVVRLGVFDGPKLTAGYQLYSTKFPRTDKTVWLLLRSVVPDKETLTALEKLGREQNAIFMKLEPDFSAIVGDTTQDGELQKAKEYLIGNGCVVGKPFFATHTFWIDLTLSSETLMDKMKEKTRYNVRLASKHGVVVNEVNTDEALENHLSLMFGTAKRQGFAAHTPDYHRRVWQLLKSGQDLKAYLLQATYQNELVVSWMLFKFHDTLYYPYGASSEKHREVMSSHAMMWGAIEFGKEMGCKRFDLWGAAAPNYTPNDPWAGFTRFKEGFGPDWIAYPGSFDMVIDPKWYKIYNWADKARGVARRFGISM